MRVFVPKRGDNGEWRMLRNKVLHNLYRSPNIVRVIKSRRLSWASHVARMEEINVLIRLRKEIIRDPL